MLTNEGLGVLKNRDKILLPFENALPSEKSLKATGTFVPKNRAGTGSSGGLLFPKPSGKNGKSKKSSLRADFVLLKKTENSSFAGNEENFQKKSPDQNTLFMISGLKKWRKNKAEEMNVPPYVIFGDKTLHELAAKKPKSMDELLDCYGIGENKAAKFGKEILEQIQKF